MQSIIIFQTIFPSIYDSVRSVALLLSMCPGTHNLLLDCGFVKNSIRTIFGGIRTSHVGSFNAASSLE